MTAPWRGFRHVSELATLSMIHHIWCHQILGDKSRQIERQLGMGTKDDGYDYSARVYLHNIDTNEMASETQVVHLRRQYTSLGSVKRLRASYTQAMSLEVYV